MNSLHHCSQQLEADGAGAAMYRLIEQLYPICRSITGNGVRRTLDILGKHLPLQRHEVPTGTPAFDWTIPREWNIRDAWIKDADGRKLVDFAASNLHVVNYSTPVHGRFNLDELQPHLHSEPRYPDWIPYRTSYYKDAWGFCLSERQRQALAPGVYEVCIDADLAPGHLSYAECVIRGERPQEVLLFAHTCHPSLCNDNLSGVALLTQLGQYLAAATRRWTYRLVFAPATIGSITWLSRNETRLDDIVGGLVVSVVGDRGGVTYKRSRHRNAWIDRAAACVLMQRGLGERVLDFSPWGYDERQFCSPGINLPMGRLTRSPNGEFPEYHTSADNLELVSAADLQDSLSTVLDILHVLETDDRLLNLHPKGEPQLGRRGLYQMMGGHSHIGDLQHALLWVLNGSDGQQSLLDIATQSGLRYALIEEAASLAREAALLAPAGSPPYEKQTPGGHA